MAQHKACGIATLRDLGVACFFAGVRLGRVREHRQRAEGNNYE
ncbi:MULTISPECIES: hypothetical protein [unclassified Nostoc]|nr:MULTISPECIES: hypothetical protein [unclassified Nostoc]